MINITQYPTPNKGSRNGYTPDLIVMHIAEGNYEGTIEWFANKKSGVSSHFLIGSNGEIAQFVPLTQAAFTQGTSTNPSSNVYYGNSTLPVVVERKTNANYYSISIEFEGFYQKTKGAITPQQFASATLLMRYIVDQTKNIYGTTIPLDRSHVVGHYQISPKTKINDPGELFPFEELITAANGSSVFKANDTVRIKATASKYVTGETIPDFVKQGIYTVEKIDGNQILLSDIKSLVYNYDLYKI